MWLTYRSSFPFSRLKSWMWGREEVLKAKGLLLLFLSEGLTGDCPNISHADIQASSWLFIVREVCPSTGIAGISQASVPDADTHAGILLGRVCCPPLECGHCCWPLGDSLSLRDPPHQGYKDPVMSA